MKVVWTDRAKARLHQINGYIAQEHPLNASRVVDRLTLQVAQLAEHPHSGRGVVVYQRRELRELIQSRYRIIHAAGIVTRFDKEVWRELESVGSESPRAG
jgi:plasmid stabilization system protein ParE